MSVKFKNSVFTVSILILIIIFMISFLNQKGAIAQPPGWSDDIRLTNNTNSSILSVIGVWENYVHVFWCEREPEPPTTTRDIFYKRSSDSGKTWEISRKLIGTPYNSIKPSIAINRSTIHMVWKDDRLADSAIFYTRSEDNGTTWIPEINISTPNGGTGYPDIAVNSNDIHVVFMISFKIYYVNSTDNGISWSEAQQLTSPIRDSDHPAIAVNGSNIHIVWRDHYDKNGQSTAGAIFYMNSTDGGLTWSEDINLTEMDLDATYPYIVANGSTIHVVYSKEITGLWQGYYRRSEDNGITWTDDIKIMNPPNDLFIDDFTMENNRLYVVGGEKYIPDEEIYFVKSIDNGQNWEDDVRFTYYLEDSQEPNIAVYNNKLNVVWQDYRDGSGNPEIYYKRYPFYHPPTNLTINIWNTNLTLNWTTPKDSPSPLDYYLIYRVTDQDAFTFSDSEIVYNSSGTGYDLLTTWNDTIALLDENTNYYYVVRAVYEDGEIDTNENIVGKFIIPLNQEWNLISIPLSQNDTKISEVLKSINGNYNIVQWYDAKDGIWRSSSTSLTNINQTMGFWIHIKNKCNLSVVGALLESTDIILYEGWNLVGYPSLITRNLNDALSGITWQAVQQYDTFDSNDLWKHNSTKKPDRLNDLKEMQPGCGYWVYVTINDTWVRTRTVEDNKVVIWRVGGCEERIINDQPNYEPTIENLIKIEEDDYQTNNIDDEKPIINNEKNNLTISLAPLIILIISIFAKMGLLHKNRR